MAYGTNLEDNKNVAADSNPPNNQKRKNKRLCLVCGNITRRKHFSVYVCNSCAGFFRRNLEHKFTCPANQNCIMGKNQRDNCKFCRYNKCIEVGMKRETQKGQEEKQKIKKCEQQQCSTSDDKPTKRISEAEKIVEDQTLINIFQAVNVRVYQLVQWAKKIHKFSSLPIQDKLLLLRASWRELLIVTLSYISVDAEGAIFIKNRVTIHRDHAHKADVGELFDRVLTELVAKMREMNVDLTEFGYLLTIILFKPGVKGLKTGRQIESIKDNIYFALEEHARETKPDEPGRFAEFLLFLRALKSISAKCLKHLFFCKLIIETSLMDMLLDPSFEL